MTELGVVRTHLLRRALPFALTIALGVLSASASRHLSSRKSELKARDASTPVSHSRTWMTVKSRPSLSRPLMARDASGLQVVRLRARFDADGKVSQIVPLSESLPGDLITQISDAAEEIRFTPPTEDGRPLAETVDVTYEVKALCACGNDLLDDGRCQGGYNIVPVNLSVSIVSVEGAKESEGWRVVYE